MKPDLTIGSVCLRYLASCSSTQVANDFRNALFRYLVPAMGGPEPSASKRRRLSAIDRQQAVEFLKRYPIEEFPVLLPLSGIFDRLGTSTGQQERVRRSLQLFIDWAREEKILALPKNLLPKDLCADIETDIYSHLSLPTQNPREVVQAFEMQEQQSRAKDFLRFVLVRYVVPGCGGPVPLHQPLTVEEMESGLNYLEQIPLEYLNAADTIVTRVMRIWGMSEAQETRVRRILRQLLTWARENGYLPEPGDDEPVPDFPTSNIPPTPAGEAIYPQAGKTLKDCFDARCDRLLQIHSSKAVKAFETYVVKYGVPALEGPAPGSRQPTKAERTQAMKFLSALPAARLDDMGNAVETFLVNLEVSAATQRNCIEQIQSWLGWARQAGYFGLIQESEVVFNTFYTNGQARKRFKPGMHLSRKRAPVHVLGAKRFPNDYVNHLLKDELEAYQQHRQGVGARTSAIVSELYQLKQYLGWLHRYEGVSLEEMSLKHILQISPLQINAEDYLDAPERYPLDQKIAINRADKAAAADVKRITRYLEDFLETNAASKLKRIAGFIALGKFQYADLIGTADFPTVKHIPVLRQLFERQATYSQQAKSQPSTISYFETSISWQSAIHAMEMQRRRVEQRQIYIKRKTGIKGFMVKHRSDAAIANELRKFLIVAFHIVCPSRPRTYYDLRIGETFKEGILTKARFIPATELSNTDLRQYGVNETAFYIHHQPDDYKSGKDMPDWILHNNGWWLEIPNLSFGTKDFYHYIRQWLVWGREIYGPCEHPYFFRLALSNQPIRVESRWGNYLKHILEYWTGVPVSPTSMRKMFSTTFSDPKLKEGAALLLQHSEKIHTSHYDQRICAERMHLILKANEAHIQETLNSLPA